MADVPFGRWRTQTFVAGLCCDELVAPGSSRESWMVPLSTPISAHKLAPSLSRGDVVILDNLNVHKSPRAAQALAERGAWFLFLPKYSPDPRLREDRLPIRSKWPSPSSRPSCERPRPEPMTSSGAPSAISATSSSPRNAGIISRRQGMLQINRRTL
jgi:hypothetical protein